MSRNTRLALFGLAALAILTGGVAWTARGFIAPPTAVAVVNLERLMSGELKELVQIQTKVQSQMQADIDRFNSLEQELLAAQERYSAERDSLPRNEVLALEATQLRLQAARESQLELNARMEAILGYEDMAALYENIYSSIARIAERDGWDIVLLDTTSIPVWQQQNLQRIRAAAQQRQVMFRSTSVDITGDVLTLMNNEFAAAGGQIVNP